MTKPLNPDRPGRMRGSGTRPEELRSDQRAVVVSIIESTQTYVEAFNRGDRAAVRDHFTATYSMRSERSVAHSGDVSGQDAIANELSFLDTFERVEAEVLEVRGDHHALTRFRFIDRHGSFIEVLVVEEAGLDGRVLRANSFDPTALDRATQRLSSWATSLGAGHDENDPGRAGHADP